MSETITPVSSMMNQTYREIVEDLRAALFLATGERQKDIEAMQDARRWIKPVTEDAVLARARLYDRICAAKELPTPNTERAELLNTIKILLEWTEWHAASHPHDPSDKAGIQEDIARARKVLNREEASVVPADVKENTTTTEAIPWWAAALEKSIAAGDPIGFAERVDGP